MKMFFDDEAEEDDDPEEDEDEDDDIHDLIDDEDDEADEAVKDDSASKRLADRQRRQEDMFGKDAEDLEKFVERRYGSGARNDEAVDDGSEDEDGQGGGKQMFELDHEPRTYYSRRQHRIDGKFSDLRLSELFQALSNKACNPHRKIRSYSLSRVKMEERGRLSYVSCRNMPTC